MSIDKSVNNFLEKGLFLTYNTKRRKLDVLNFVSHIFEQFAVLNARSPPISLRRPLQGGEASDRRRISENEGLQAFTPKG